MAPEQWPLVVRQLETLLEEWTVLRQAPCRAHINLTGGEPFAHPGFLPLLETLARKRPRLSFAILTNGTLLDAATSAQLARLKPGFVQVSLEGTEPTHDRIRGPGNFARVLGAIRLLQRARVPVLVAFTAHRGNFTEFPAVARLAADLRVRRVWADRFIPEGAGAAAGLQTLSPQETREFIRLLDQAAAEAKRRWFGRTEVARHRALQFLGGSSFPYRCTAGDSLLALLPNGDVLPCRRLPLRAGNLLDAPLHEIYRDAPVLKSLRHPGQAIAGCAPCAFRHTCHGGLKCLAYAIHGDPFRGDPGCWLSEQERMLESVDRGMRG
jgi:radical SAM protein with 4Fe4S-binding SPASM domain